MSSVHFNGSSRRANHPTSWNQSRSDQPVKEQAKKRLKREMIGFKFESKPIMNEVKTKLRDNDIKIPDSVFDPPNLERRLDLEST